jgi:hypothetical protein
MVPLLTAQAGLKSAIVVCTTLPFRDGVTVAVLVGVDVLVGVLGKGVDVLVGVPGTGVAVSVGVLTGPLAP